jgi:hypothetical protein
MISTGIQIPVSIEIANLLIDRHKLEALAQPPKKTAI